MMKEYKLKNRAEKVGVMMMAADKYLIPKGCMIDMDKSNRRSGRVSVDVLYATRFEKCLKEARKIFAESKKYYDRYLKKILEGKGNELISDKEMDRIAELAIADKPIENGPNASWRDKPKVRK